MGTPRAAVEPSTPRWDVRDGHVHQAPALMGEDHEDEQQAARRGRHHEEVRGHDLPDVIVHGRAPRLQRGLPTAIMYLATVA